MVCDDHRYEGSTACQDDQMLEGDRPKSNEDTRTLTGWESDRGCLASLGMEKDLMSGELPHNLTHQDQRRNVWSL